MASWSRGRRMGAALGASLAGHVLAAGVLAYVAARGPHPPERPVTVVPLAFYERPGGGGGGGTPGPPSPVAAPPPSDEAPPPAPARTPPVLRPVPKAAVVPRKRPARPPGPRVTPSAPVPGGSESAGAMAPRSTGGDHGADASGSGAGGGAGEGAGGGAGTGDGSGGDGSGAARPAHGRNPKPPYPLAARRQGLEGVVLLEVRVLADGSPADVRVRRSSGHPMLDESAAMTVRTRWRFLPARRGAEPVESVVTFAIRFDLQTG